MKEYIKKKINLSAK